MYIPKHFDLLFESRALSVYAVITMYDRVGDNQTYNDIQL